MKYLNDRQEIAYVMNSGRFPVIRINLETAKQGYDGLYIGDLVKILTPTKTHHLYVVGNVFYSRGSGGKFYVLSKGKGLKDSFGYSDVMKMLKSSQAPVISADDVVILIEDYPKIKLCKVRVMKLGKYPSAFMSPCATLEDVPDDYDISVPERW